MMKTICSSVFLAVSVTGTARAEVTGTVTHFYQAGDLNNVVVCLDTAAAVLGKDGFGLRRDDPVIHARREDGAGVTLTCAKDRVVLEIVAPDRGVYNVLADDDYLKP